MARRVRSTDLETRSVRLKLRQSGKPYYQAIGPGLHVGYRKGKRGGRWVARFYLGDGAYEVTTIGASDDVLDADGTVILDFWQAQEVARRDYAKKVKGETARAGAYRVRDAIEEYLAWLATHRKGVRDARYRAEALILPELGSVDTAKLTTERIRGWLRNVAETPARLRTKAGEEPRHRASNEGADNTRRRRASANRVLTILKAALNRAFNEEKIATDKVWRRVEPFPQVEQPRIRYLTIAEARRLANAAAPDFRLLVQAALQTGCRYGELTNLLVNDINPDVGTVAIRQSKSGKARHVVLTDEGVVFFNQLAAGRPGDDRLLVKANGKSWGDSHQARPMAEANARARLSPPITFHGLRHTWASHAVMNGVPLMVVARNLGHTDTRMVERHYGHLAQSYIVDAIRAGAPQFGSFKRGNVSPLGR